MLRDTYQKSTWRVLALLSIAVLSVSWTGQTARAQKLGLSKEERHQTLAHAALVMAEELYGAGQVDQAIEHWHEALGYDDSLTEAHYHLGLVLRDTGKLEQSIKHLRRAVSLDPENAMAFADLGDTLREHGDIDGAIVAYVSALHLVPDSAVLRSNYGYLLVRKGNVTEAVAAWRDAARLDPNYPAPHLNLGEALEGQGDIPGAIASYEKFLDLVPNAPNTAEVKERLGKLKAAGGETAEDKTQDKEATQAEAQDES